MYTDQGLLLAAVEAVPNGSAAPGGLGGNSITGVAATPYFLDLADPIPGLGAFGVSDLAFAEFELSVQIPTSFTAGPNILVEFRLVSLPILPTCLTAAGTSGRLLTFGGTGVAATDIITPANGTHSFPMGAPIYFSALTGGAGAAIDTLYYIKPSSATGFQLFPTWADLIAGTNVVNFTTDITAMTAVVSPYVHMTTGPVQAAFLRQGVRLTGRTIQGHSTGLGKLMAPFAGDSPRPLGASIAPLATVGSGGGTRAVPAPGRFLCSQVLVTGSGLDTTGRYSAQLAVNAGNQQKHYPTAFSVL